MLHTVWLLDILFFQVVIGMGRELVRSAGKHDLCNFKCIGSLSLAGLWLLPYRWYDEDLQRNTAKLSRQRHF